MQRDDKGGARTDFASATTDIAEKLEQERQSATELIQDAREKVTRRAGDYASEAQQVLSAKAEQTQRDIGSSLTSFGGALRAASDHLANSDQGPASRFLLDAAGGLERLSSSLKDKPFSEVLEDVQSFGRQHPGALVAGSVLAGLALSRFVKASSPDEPNSPRNPVGEDSDQNAEPAR